jgi:uncharacterized protein YjhX (UPF0386 family)
MQKIKVLLILHFFCSSLFIQNSKAQNFGLKIISVSDSSVITTDLKRFDSLWSDCMFNYGRKDISYLFSDYEPNISKTNPITLLNFITGVEIPLSDMFVFRLVYSHKFNDSVKMYQLDMGWMQIAVLYNNNRNKLMRFESINSFNLSASTYKNLTVFTSQKINKKELVNSYKQVNYAINDLGLDKDSFSKLSLRVYSGSTLKDAYSYIGGLEYINFFNPKAQFGGMGDPFNKVILSGINKTVHVHELMHFAIPFKCNFFLGEGLASYYGGIAGNSFQVNLQEVLEFIKNKGIHTFSDALLLWRTEPYFNSVRGSYVFSAFMLYQIRKDFPLETYRNFVRNCKSDEEMIESLKKLYNLDSEVSVFNRIYYGI